MNTRTTILATLLLVVFLVESRKESFSQTPIPNMVWIPAGTFTMGSPDSEPARYLQEGPQTRVTLTQGFWMGKYEVTQGEYLSVIGNNPSHYNGVRHDYDWRCTCERDIDYGIDLNRPVEMVNWFDVTNYCIKLTVRERNAGRIPTSWVYRLPTGAELEYACRAGTTAAFHYGPALRSGMANFEGHSEYPPCGWQGDFCFNPSGIYLGRTTTVGSYLPNAWGFYDMHGNVWEWCSDYDSSRLPGGSVNDPQGPELPGLGSRRLFRGGSFNGDGRHCRSAYYEGGLPEVKHIDFGFRVVISPTIPLWKQTIVALPVQPTYSTDLPVKEIDKDSLIVVTHGRIPKEDGQTFPPDEPWVDEMVTKINNYLISQGKDRWIAVPYKWLDSAWTTKSETFFEKVLRNGRKEGVSLGKRIGQEGWSHVHLIAHSAGSELVQAATLEILKANPFTEIHTTFLDAFVGTWWWPSIDGVQEYGEFTDWSDSYFTHDTDTFTPANFTESPLDHAYNVDVTWLDTRKYVGRNYQSALVIGALLTCTTTKSIHAWPIEFYMNSIPPSPPGFDPEGLGFQLSKEGGGWSTATTTYQVQGRDQLHILGTPDSCTLPRFSPPEPVPTIPINFNAVPVSQSLQGVEGLSLSSFGLKISTPQLSPLPDNPPRDSPQHEPVPAWLAIFQTVTNMVNIMSFDAYFTSTNEEGLLSVYWDTNLLDTVDERVVYSGVQKYSFELPTRYTNGVHVLGFRLDAYNDTSPGIIVSNIVFGFVGIKDPFSISFTGLQTNGLQIMKLDGPAMYNYTVQGSTNLTDWVQVCTLVNTNGVVYFLDVESTNYPQRFYRATVP